MKKPFDYLLQDQLKHLQEQAWTQTHCGVAVDLLNPNSRTIGLLDICRHLSRILRYNGGGNPVITVAEHCVLGARMVHEDIALEFLMHDAHEAYTGDITRPVIVAIQAICVMHGAMIDPVAEIKRRLQRAIDKKWDLKTDARTMQAVRDADLRMLQTERQQILGPPPKPWFLPDSVKPYDLAIEGWPPARAELEFRGMFIELASERGIRLTGELTP